MCFTQDDTLGWGAVVALGRRDAEDDVPYRFCGFLNLMPVGEGSLLPIF